MHGMICAIMKSNGVSVRHLLKRVDLNVFFLIKESILIIKFDSQVTKAKRLYWYKVQSDLLDNINTNQSEFWKSIGKAGISTNKNIPMEVVLVYIL